MRMRARQLLVATMRSHPTQPAHYPTGCNRRIVLLKCERRQSGHTPPIMVAAIAGTRRRE